MSSDVLTFKEHRSRSFPKDTYRWIDVWEFSLEKPDSDSSIILGSILESEHYPFSFIAPYPNPTAAMDGPMVRGPFLLDRLTPDSFEIITAREAWKAIDAFLEEWDPPATRRQVATELQV